VDFGADMDSKNDEGFTPFHVALRQGTLEGVAKLLQCGQNVNQVGGN